MKQRRKNLKTVVTSPKPLITGCISGGILFLIGRYFSDISLMIGNYGHTKTYIEIGLFLLLVILFSIFIAATVYKIQYFGEVDKKSGSIGGLGGFLGMLIAGCPACSITLASYLGLASVISLLPYGGLELKVGGVILLMYAVWKTVDGLYVCEMGRKV